MTRTAITVSGGAHELQVSIDTEDARAVVDARGAVGIAAAPELSALLEEAHGARVTDVVLDLKGVTHLDSAALGAILVAQKRLAACGGRFVVSGAEGNVRRALETTRLRHWVAAEGGQSEERVEAKR